MGSKKQKRADFLVAFKAFFITVICCLLVFLIVAFAVLQKSEKSTPEPEEATTTSSHENEAILIVYNNANEYGFAAVVFNWNEPGYALNAVPDKMVNYKGETDSLSSILRRKGLTELVNAYNSSEIPPASGYIVFSSESLAKIVNRFGGLTGENNLRITGSEAAGMANAGSTEEVFSKLSEKFFDEHNALSLKNRFLYLISVTENNLSYTEFYKRQQQLERIE